MKRFLSIVLLLFSFEKSITPQNSGRLKSVIYDFDGLDIGAKDLPDGDYCNNDLTYNVQANPLQHSPMLGDRVLELDLTWNTGNGEFGKAIGRYIELDPKLDRLNFYFYCPPGTSGNITGRVSMTEDDNLDNVFEDIWDDRWTSAINIPRTQGWQLISIALSELKDDNQGGNGIFDAGYTNAAGMIFSVGLIFTPSTQSAPTEKYFVDMLSISEGPLPTGNSILELPPETISDTCRTGALGSKATPDSVPDEIESLFNNTKKLSYVNWFLDYTRQGTNPDALPGTEVTNLLARGYRPVITWEMMYGSYARLDPVQPRLDKLLSGNFDTYIDQFADRIRSYNDTVILRIFHEFDGNWYPWSLTENKYDPATYVAAYRYVVDRFRARGASKVQWMWCVNAEPKPYRVYNWIVNAYPGDAYVNIVATDIYNHPDLGTPPWKSFRHTLAETYYYLTRYFPNKPFYICEVGCRERDGAEAQASQTKAEWTCQMSADLRSFFYKTKALIFFSTMKEHDWRINSSTEALQAAKECIWNDRFFGDTVSVHDIANKVAFRLYPNPFINELTIEALGPQLAELSTQLSIYNLQGENVYTRKGLRIGEKLKLEPMLPAGIYFVELKNSSYRTKLKVVKAGS